jgi:4-amino-4-deoxy-L-arabinose transferase-like glycosyltransferase
MDDSTAPERRSDTDDIHAPARFSVRGLTVPLLFAAGIIVAHLVLNYLGGYGIFRDELYYLACAEHPATGYVDQPPLSILILAVSRLIIGDSLFALRFLPALASGATLFLVGLIVRDLGGGTRAQIFACIAWTCSPINLGIFGIYQINVFDVLAWALALKAFSGLMRAPSPRQWLLLGLLLGLGLMNKISVLWLCAGIAAGIVFSERREMLRTPWPYAAAGIALLLFLPYVLWNVAHDFAHLEFIRNAGGGKYAGLTPWSFLQGQLLIENPVTFPVWFGGLLVLAFAPGMRTFRPLAVVYAVAMVILLVNGHSKAEYLSAAYPPLFAGGGVLAERLVTTRWRRWLGGAYCALVVITGAALAPFALPVLPVETYIRYADALGVAPSTSESMQLERLPQFYADMFGWERKATDVAAVYNALPEADRKRCAIFANNYGRCAAIDYYGPRLGLPKAIGDHNNYWLWGPRGYTGELVIILGGALADKKQVFDSVRVAAISSAPLCMPYENNLAIYVCRGLKVPLADFWPRLKHYQ